MYTKVLHGTFTLGMLFTLSLSSPTPDLQERTDGCSPDNVLRALIRFSASATPFCSAYISIAPTSTVYVTTPIATPTITVDPTILPSYVSQYDASRVSSACSCLSIPPSVATLSPYPDSSCDNQGLAYALQSHSFYNSDAPKYSSVNVEYFKAAPVLQSGFTTVIGFASIDATVPYSVYGGAAVNTDYKSVNHRGYFVPPVSGEYTIISETTDDLALVWLGPSAFNEAYTRANAVLEQGTGASVVVKSYTVSLTAGEYYPFRMLFVNGQFRAGFELKIVGPGGEVLVPPASSDDKSLFVQFSCDGKSPAFKNFGQEI